MTFEDLKPWRLFIFASELNSGADAWVKTGSHTYQRFPLGYDDSMEYHVDNPKVEVYRNALSMLYEEMDNAHPYR